MFGGLGILLLATWLAAAATPATAQGPDNRVGLVVRFGNGAVFSQCQAYTPDMTGLDLLRRAGLEATIEYSSLGALVCKLNAPALGTDGCDYPQQDCLCQARSLPWRYWAYWRLDGGDWTYSDRGAAGRRLSPGVVDGWAWGEGTTDFGARPPRLSFSDVCPPPTATLPPPPPTDTPRPRALATDPPTLTATPLPSATATQAPPPVATPHVGTPHGASLPTMSPPPVATPHGASLPTTSPPPVATPHGASLPTMSPTPVATPHVASLPTTSPPPRVVGSIDLSGLTPVASGSSAALRDGGPPLGYAVFAAIVLGLVGMLVASQRVRR